MGRLGTRKNRSGEMTYEKLWMNDDLHSLLTWQWKNRHPKSPYVFCHMNPKSKSYRSTVCGTLEDAETALQEGKGRRIRVSRHPPLGGKYLNDLHKVGLKKVQQILRHRRQSTTEIYVEGNYGDTKDALKLLELENLKNLQKN